MRRFFLPPEGFEGNRFRLTGKDAHHAIRVLRLRVGESLVLLDGKGGAFWGIIERIDSEVTGSLTGPAPSAPEMPLPITLAPALLKGEKFDWVLQKSTELGVHRIQPLLCERCVVQGKEGKEGKISRWQGIAREAAEQCERLLVPDVLPPLPLSKLPFEGTVLYCAERSGEPMPQVLPSLEPERLTVVIGPEGGFSPREDDWLRERGAIPVSLGTRILRAETASIAVLSMLLYRYGFPETLA